MTNQTLKNSILRVDYNYSIQGYAAGNGIDIHSFNQSIILYLRLAEVPRSIKIDRGKKNPYQHSKSTSDWQVTHNTVSAVQNMTLCFKIVTTVGLLMTLVKLALSYISLHLPSVGYKLLADQYILSFVLIL